MKCFDKNLNCYIVTNKLEYLEYFNISYCDELQINETKLNIIVYFDL